MTVLLAWLALSVAAAAFLSMGARALIDEDGRPSPARRRRRRATWSQVALLAGAVALTASQSRPEEWQPLSLVGMLAALAVAGDAVPLTLGRYRFTGSFVAIVLAMALLGAAPAVAIGVLAVGIDAIRRRSPFPNLLNNLAAYATFPLVGGVVLAEVSGVLALSVACFAVAIAVNLLNFVIVAGYFTLRDGDSLAGAIRRAWLPALRWEVATALIAALAVYGYFTIGATVVAGLAVSLAVLQIVAARIAAAAAAAPPHILKTP